MIRQVAVSEKSGSGSGDNGFRGVLEGRFGADDSLGEKNVPGWKQMGVYLQPPEGQKINSGLFRQVCARIDKSDKQPQRGGLMRFCKRVWSLLAAIVFVGGTLWAQSSSGAFSL